MDARDWHRQATTPAPTWPDPVSITDFDGLSRKCRDNYFRRLAGAMNATVVVPRPMEAVAAHLDDIVATNRLRPPGAMPMVAVTAPFSAGKSTLLKHWGFGVHRGVLGGQANEERPTWSPQPGLTADWVPVVYVTLMASSSIKEINALILLYLGYPPEGLARTTTTRVLHALRMHGVQVVILDDAHMLRTTSAQGRAVLDYIKFLNTELGEVNRGTVILVGAHLESTAILDDPQIRARLTTMTIDAFQITTIEKKAAWQDLLATVGDRPLQHLPDAAPDLFVARLAEHIWRRTQGFVGETTRLISRSVLDAVHDRRSVITHDDLDAVDLSDRSIDGQLDQAKGKERRS